MKKKEIFAHISVDNIDLIKGEFKDIGTLETTFRIIKKKME